VFFPTLMRLATDTAWTYTRTASTADVQGLFSEASGTDLSPLFHLYLYTTQKLEIHVVQTGPTKYLIRSVNIGMSLPVDVTTAKGTSRVLIDSTGATVDSDMAPQIDSRGFYLKKLIYE
jgi:hypothetical protein